MAVKLGMLIHDGTQADEGKGNEKKQRNLQRHLAENQESIAW